MLVGLYMTCWWMFIRVNNTHVNMTYGRMYAWHAGGCCGGGCCRQVRGVWDGKTLANEVAKGGEGGGAGRR